MVCKEEVVILFTNYEVVKPLRKHDCIVHGAQNKRMSTLNYRILATHAWRGRTLDYKHCFYEIVVRTNKFGFVNIVAQNIRRSGA